MFRTFAWLLATAGWLAATPAPLLTAEAPSQALSKAQPVHQVMVGPARHLGGPEPALAGGTSCVGLGWPVSGPVVAAFAPVGRYAGHWGIDIAVEPGSTVRSAAAGTVTFSGTVAGNQTVTVEHGGGLKTSYSYLSERAVGRGAHLVRGAPVGSSGRAHETDALHFSVRRDGSYLDPRLFLGCQARGPGGAVYLVPAFPLGAA